jgi:hypothetical protein
LGIRCWERWQEKHLLWLCGPNLTHYTWSSPWHIDSVKMFISHLSKKGIIWDIRGERRWSCPSRYKININNTFQLNVKTHFSYSSSNSATNKEFDNIVAVTNHSYDRLYMHGWYPKFGEYYMDIIDKWSKVTIFFRFFMIDIAPPLVKPIMQLNFSIISLAIQLIIGCCMSFKILLIEKD